MKFFFIHCALLYTMSAVAQNTFPATGNVGIGTASPAAKLHIVVSNGINLSLTGNSKDYVGPEINLKRSASLPYVGQSPAIQFGDDQSNGGSIIQSYQGNLQFFTAATSWAEAMRIQTNGNVGIGTATPPAKLSIKGALVLGDITAGNLDPASGANINYLKNSGQMLIGWNRSAGAGETDFVSNQGAGSLGGFAFYNYNNQGNETQLMWLRGDGNLAIGTSDPMGYKLAVNGSMIATSVTVKLRANWPDYVFQKGYNLPTLHEVKKYINLFGHLPEIPSASEIVQNGLELGEMNKALTKKIEELTLYAIDQQDKIEKLSVKNRLLEVKLENLAKKVDALGKKTKNR